MVTIELQNLGKRYNRHWIFRHINYTFQSGTAYAVTGANGSGKSTLLQVLAGAITLSEGNVLIKNAEDGAESNGQAISNRQQITGSKEQINRTNPLHVIHHLPPVFSVIKTEEHHHYLAMAAPYLELIEEMTLTEFLEFHFQFKPVMPGYSIAAIIELIQLKSAAGRQIRHYSSGMKQRVKLAQAIFSNVPIVLLDEPLTNLDAKGTDLYYELIETFCQNRLLIICSNSEPEMHFCKKRLAIDGVSQAWLTTRK